MGHRELKSVLYDNLEGWGGVGGEMEETCVYLWLIPADVWQKPTQYHKAIILQFQKKKKSEMVHSHETSFSLGCLLFKKKKKTDAENKCWWGYGEISTFVQCWWECKIVQLLWKTVLQFLNIKVHRITMIQELHSWVYSQKNWKHKCKQIFRLLWIMLLWTLM